MDPNGKKYSAENEHHIVWAKQLLDSVNFKDDLKDLIDLGCGSGEVTKLIVEKVPNARILAVDKFPSMIHQARSINADPQIEYDILDILEPLDDKYLSKADYLTSIHVLHWVNDLETAVKNISAVLKPNGGFFLVHALEFPILKDIKPVLVSKYPDVGEVIWDNLFFKRIWNTSPEEDYRQFCQMAGLEAKIEKRRLDYHFDMDRLTRDLMSVFFPAVEKFDENKRNEVLDMIVEWYKRKYRNGTFHWYIDDLVIEGKKTL